MRRTVLSFVLLLTASMLTLSSCAPLAEMTLMSNQNFEPGAKYVSKGAVTGESKMAWVLIIPLTLTGPHVDYAMDDALEKGGGDLMTNVVINDFARSYVVYSESGWMCTGEVWARADHMSAVELEGQEVFEVQSNGGVLELVSEDDPSKRFAFESKEDTIERLMAQYEEEGNSVN